MFWAAPTLDTTCVAMRELPPNSKKSSSTPTPSTPNNSPNTPATTTSTAEPGARNSRATTTGSGNAPRSTFPEDVNGNASNTTNTDGTMYDASTSPAATFNPSTSTPPPAAATT